MTTTTPPWLAHVLEVTPGALIALDSDGRTVGYNQSAHQLFARTDDTTADIVLPPALYDGVRRVLSGDTTRAQGEVAVAGQRVGYTVRPAGSQPFGEMIVFVSAQRVESGGDFLAIAAHELKTPLTAIKGGTQLLQRRVTRGESPMSDRDVELLYLVAGQVVKLTGMVENLLEASRLVRGGMELRLELQDLSSLLKRIVQEFTTPPGATFAAPDRAVHARFDPQRVTQIMRALLQNAADAKSIEPIGISVRATRSTAQITVADTGRGIVPEDEPHVFKRFYRGAGASTHLGLGLYIASELVRLQDGQMWLSTTPGKGTTVTFTLPCA